MAEEALCHQALAICHYRSKEPIRAAESYERGAGLAQAAGAWDLAGEIWIQLSGIYGELRRYGRQATALTQFLTHLGRLQCARSHEWTARYRLGQTRIRTGRPAEAIPLLREALRLAMTAGDESAAERSRSLLVAALLQMGDWETVQRLQTESETFLQEHPQAKAAAFWYWHNKALLVHSDGRIAEAAKALRQAASFARSIPTLQYAWHHLRHRFFLAEGRARDGLRAAQMARVTALQAGRYDLEFEMVQAMVSLIGEHGPEIADGLEEYCARGGFDLFRYIPEHLLQRP